MKGNETIHPVNRLGTDDEMLNSLQRETFEYFVKGSDEKTGLVLDRTNAGSCASIGVTGLAITVYIVGLEKKYMSRVEAVQRILKLLSFLFDAPQSEQEDATGYKGFFYHFLDMQTGKRVAKSELSTIDSSFLIAGALSAAMYFTGDNKNEKKIRKLAEDLFRRVDWQWALNNGFTISHGWTPEKGFLDLRWDRDYSEAIILYVLALASPTHPVDAECYRQWTATFQLKKVYDIEYLYAGPLFIHQFSHLWIDFRGIMDEFNKKSGFDYFENSKRATYVHREYAIENPKKFKRYGKYCWGLTASDGPGNRSVEVNGKEINFYGYLARGAPFGPDDGTISPWAVVASLPFAPEIVVQTIRYFIEQFNLKRENLYGLDASFNATYPENQSNPLGWVSPCQFGLNQASVIIMIENYFSGLIWNIMRGSPHIISGLTKAGFTEGWL